MKIAGEAKPSCTYLHVILFAFLARIRGTPKDVLEWESPVTKPPQPLTMHFSESLRLAQRLIFSARNLFFERGFLLRL